MIDKDFEQEYESPYCDICGGCGEEGCCSAIICKHHPHGKYCNTYLKDLQFGYLLNNGEEFDKAYKTVYE
jgi:hypothetical protein